MLIICPLILEQPGVLNYLCCVTRVLLRGLENCECHLRSKRPLIHFQPTKTFFPKNSVSWQIQPYPWNTTICIMLKIKVSFVHFRGRSGKGSILRVLSSDYSVLSLPKWMSWGTRSLWLVSKNPLWQPGLTPAGHTQGMWLASYWTSPFAKLG